MVSILDRKKKLKWNNVRKWGNFHGILGEVCTVLGTGRTKAHSYRTAWPGRTDVPALLVCI